MKLGSAQHYLGLGPKLLESDQAVYFPHTFKCSQTLGNAFRVTRSTTKRWAWLRGDSLASTGLQRSTCVREWVCIHRETVQGEDLRRKDL